MRSLSSLVALVALSGCSLLPVRTEIVTLTPPAELLLACPEPQGGPTTNGEMARHLLAWKHALRGCNLQLEEARRWPN